jgi:hypothetical protein
MMRKNLLALFVNLHLPAASHPGQLKSQVEAAYASK